MKTCSDPIACAVIRQPSISRCGTREHDLAVLERARLGLVGVDDEVDRLPLPSARKLALRPIGKNAPPRPRRFEARSSSTTACGSSSRAFSSERVAADRRGTRRAASGRARRRPRAATAAAQRPSRTSCDDRGNVLGPHGLAVAVVDRDDGAPAAAAGALDRAQGDLAVLGRLARAHAELALERLEHAAARRRARTRCSCRPRRGAGRPAPGGTCRRRTRPPCSTRASSSSASATSRNASGGSQPPCCSCASRSAGRTAERGSGYSRADRVDLLLEAASPSPVDLAHDGVERADDRDHVGDQRVLHAGRGRLAGRRTTARGT